MAVNKYITLHNNRLALQDLIDQITYVIDQGVVTLKVKGSVEFTEVLGNSLGGLRYNTSDKQIEYSNDGVLWTPLTSDSFWWEEENSYNAGTVVLHTTGWYMANAFAIGSDVPGTSGKWSLLTSGTIIKYASNTAQLAQALATPAFNVCIHLKGDFNGVCSAIVNATTVTIWSDESSSFSGSIILSTANDSNIYWHSNGTHITDDLTINVTSGTVWIDRLNVLAGKVTLLEDGATIYYRRIDGKHEGGIFNDWTGVPNTDKDDYVPKQLSDLDAIAYNKDLNLYVQDGDEYGYIRMDDIAAKVASQASAYFKINLRGVDSTKPKEAPKGYVFYATDIGALYVMGDDNVWQDPLILRGSDGKQGAPGVSLIPKISKDKDLYWEVKTYAEGEFPSVPSPISLRGESGKSAFDIWKEVQGTPTSTKEDFIDALGAGNRRIAFTKLDVSKDFKVTLDSKYPFIALQDDLNQQWSLSATAIKYNTNPPSVTISIKEVLEAKGMVSSNSFIRIQPGVYYRDKKRDVISCFEWTSDKQSIYTDSDTPSVGDKAYTSKSLTGDALVITAFAAEIPGGIETDIGVYERYPNGDTGLKYCWLSTTSEIKYIYTLDKAPEDGAIAYTDSALDPNKVVTITRGYQEATNATISTVVDTYTRNVSGDTKASSCWKNTKLDPTYVWTASSAPIKEDKAYTNEALKGTNYKLVSDYKPATEDAEINGTWYALFSGGGGDNGKSASVDIVTTTTTPPGTKATLIDIEKSYIVNNNIVYTRNPENDSYYGKAWDSYEGETVFTSTEYIVQSSTIVYKDADLEETIGVVDKSGEASTSTDRKYTISIPEGPEGRYYSIPKPFDIEKQYSPVTLDKNYYDTVLHQGSTWVYIADTPSIGNTPPELPTTANDYWSLLAAGGMDGKDIGDGIYVHSMSFRKPYSESPLHLQVMRATSPNINDASLFIDTSSSYLGRDRVLAWNNNSNKWTAVPDNGLGDDYTNQIVTVDMSDTNIEIFIFYRWVTALNKSAKWMATKFPNSSAADITDSSEETESVTVKHYIDITYDMVDSSSCVVIKPYKFALGIVDHNGTYYELDESYTVYDFDTNSTTIDLSYVFAQANVDKITGTWRLVVLDGEQQVGGIVDKYGHTHQNKAVLDNITVDVYGNILIYGVIVVPYTQRQDSMYLVDTIAFADTDQLLIPDEYNDEDTLIDPSEYSVIKVEYGLA